MKINSVKNLLNNRFLGPGFLSLAIFLWALVSLPVYSAEETGNQIKVKRARTVTLDGESKEWPESSFIKSAGPEMDPKIFISRWAATWDEQGLYLVVAVQDQDHINTDVWYGDHLTVIFAPSDCVGGNIYQEEDRVAFTICLPTESKLEQGIQAGQVIVQRNTPLEEGKDQDPEIKRKNVQLQNVYKDSFFVTRQGTATTYEFLIPWWSIRSGEQPLKGCAFFLTLNDRDPGDQKPKAHGYWPHPYRFGEMVFTN